MEKPKKSINHLIDDVSPSFCLAKWLQCTVDLYNGTTHSCHHPDRHLIPLDELKKSPQALHNTNFKVKQQNLMLEGKRPEECSYCWKIEDLNKGHESDRYIKSNDPWAVPYLDKIANRKEGELFSPTYLEVMFDNKCNLSCCYCMADVSSSIFSEMKKFGPYKVSAQAHRMSRNLEKSSLYTEAFWKWLPDIVENLHFLRITGGEPFLSPQLDKLLTYFEKNEINNNNLTLAINSNLIVSDTLLSNFIERMNNLVINGKLRNIEFYTSLEAKEKKAEYIRPGLTYDKFFKNLNYVASHLKNSRIVIMATFNVFSVTSFKDFCEDVLIVKNKYKDIILDISYLKDPEYLRSDFILNQDHKYLDEISNFLKKNISEDHSGFTEYEIKKFLRIYDWIKTDKNPDEILRQRADFYNFVNEYDKRKGTSFIETFPEYDEFYKVCRKSRKFQDIKF
jgi:pyruvate-formate lyase-activating enzyme